MRREEVGRLVRYEAMACACELLGSPVPTPAPTAAVELAYKSRQSDAIPSSLEEARALWAALEAVAPTAGYCDVAPLATLPTVTGRAGRRRA